MNLSLVFNSGQTPFRGEVNMNSQIDWVNLAKEAADWFSKSGGEMSPALRALSPQEQAKVLESIPRVEDPTLEDFRSALSQYVN